MSGADNTIGTDRADAAEAPALLPPVALPQRAPVSANGALVVLGVVAVIGGAAMATYSGYTVRLADRMERTRPGLIAIDASGMNGAFVLMDKELAAERPHLLRTLAMPEAERQRVAEALREGRVRIAAVTLWDNFDQDADVVEITAGGFSQRVTITHTQKTYFIPVVPGGTVRITAQKDGGGGGVTLGVRTMLGNHVLPPLAPGQFVEVPAL